MAILSNVDIEKFIQDKKLELSPYEPENIQGATIDLRLGNKFLIPLEYDSEMNRSFITLKDKLEYKEVEANEIILMPHNFILGSTLEKITLSNFLSARVDGKSRIARKGLIIQGAGHVAPGFEGNITLEIYNQRNIPIKLMYKEEICQIEIHELKTPSTKIYSGRYFGQKGPKV